MPDYQTAPWLRSPTAVNRLLMFAGFCGSHLFQSFTSALVFITLTLAIFRDLKWLHTSYDILLLGVIVRILCHRYLHHLAAPRTPAVAEFASEHHSAVCWVEWAMMEDDATEFLSERAERFRETPNHALQRTVVRFRARTLRIFRMVGFTLHVLCPPVAELGC